jgi:uncharacterized membrane protein SpoIIM required for sporulation
VNVGTSLRSGVRVLTERPASVLPVYLLVVGISAVTRVPVLVGLAAIIGLLAADGRLDTLLTELQAADLDELSDTPQSELGPETLPPELEAAVIDLFSPEIAVLFVGSVFTAIVVSILANGLGNAAALNGIYGCLYGKDGVRDAVDGVGRDWKPFVGITLAQVGVILLGAVPVALGAGLFTLSPVAGTAATLVGGLLSAAIIIGGLLALAFAGQSVVVDGVGFGSALRRSAGFPFRQPIPFVAYVLVTLAVFGALSVLGGLFSVLGVSQLSGILSPLVALPFLDAFKTALYADRPFSPPADQRQPAAAETQLTDGGDQRTVDEQAAVDDESVTVDDESAMVDDEHTMSTGDSASAADKPPYRQRFVGAFRDGLAALGGFVRGHPVPILVAAVVFGLASVGGWQLTAQYALDLPPGGDVGEVFGTFPLAVFVMIAANNWLVSATAIYGGVALGVPTAVDMLLNGFIVGAVYGVVEPLTFLALVGPHGVIELPAIIVAGGLGFHLAATVAGVFRGTRPSTELADALRVAYRILLGLAVVLVIASFVEAFLTPAIAEAVLS